MSRRPLWRPAPAPACAPGGPGAMTVDVEEHYHAAALAPAYPRAGWGALPSRVEDNTRRLLDLFAASGATATFFTLGSVARAHPALVRAIVAGGHELASHGDAHVRVGSQCPAEFRADVCAAKAALEDAGGVAVAGYRAANFSIDRSTWWAYEALAEEGYRYSSSVNPISHDHYGLRDAPRAPFMPTDGDFLEIPVTTVEAAGRRWPAGGGGYFRLAPYAPFRWAVRRVRARDGLAPNFYLHPWEIDPGQPRADVSGRARFRHYVNLGRMEGKLKRLLAEFPWARMDRVYAGHLAAASQERAA